jgi:hypothetical protein
MTAFSFDSARSLFAWVKSGLLPSAWVLLLFNLLSARNEEMLGPRALPPEFAASRSETLSLELVIGAIEVTVLTVVLQPWRQRPLWPWGIAGFALFLPWTLLAFAIGLHGGSMSVAHTFWRLGILVVIGGVSVLSGLRALIRRGRAGI